MGCSCRSRASLSSCVAASELPTGGGWSGRRLFFLTAVRFWVVACCARGPAMHTLEKQKNSPLAAKGSAARKSHGIFPRGAGREADIFLLRVFLLTVPEVSELAPRHWRGIWIFAECGWVTFAQDFNHPVIEVIDGMDQDRLKTPVIFFMCFLNIISQTQTNVFMFSPQTDVIGTEHFNVLHRNFGDAIRPAVQVLFLRLQVGNIKRCCRGRQLLNGIDRRSPGRSSRNVLRKLPGRRRGLLRQVTCTTPPNVCAEGESICGSTSAVANLQSQVPEPAIGLRSYLAYSRHLRRVLLDWWHCGPASLGRGCRYFPASKKHQQRWLRPRPLPITRRRPGCLRTTPRIGKARPGMRPTMQRRCEPVRWGERIGRTRTTAGRNQVVEGLVQVLSVRSAYSAFRAGFEKRLFQRPGIPESQLPSSAYFHKCIIVRLENRCQQREREDVSR